MKKKLFLFTLMLQASSSLFAQSARTDINSLMSTWLIPIVGFLMLAAFIGLVIHNMDALLGKNGLSKQDGWINVGTGLIYVACGIAAISFVATKVAGMNFTI